MTVLGIDASSKSAAVGIVRDGKVLAEFFINNKLTHSTTLMPMVENALKIAELDFEDIDLIGVTEGPGSFTGVRIGITTAKGLCAPKDIPCAGISSLEAIAYSALPLKGIICPIMDARLSQVYNALFVSDGEKLVRICEDRALSLAELKQELEEYETVYLCGDGTPVYSAEFADMDKVTAVNEQNTYIKGGSVALLAQEKYTPDGDFSASKLTPQYLRLPQAERELQNKGRKL